MPKPKTPVPKKKGLNPKFQSIQKIGSLGLSTPFNLALSPSNLIPTIAQGAMREVALDPRCLSKLGDALRQHLSPDLCSAINLACSWFIFSVVHAAELPHADRYILELRSKSSEAGKALWVLINETFEVPASYRTTAVLPARDHFAALITQRWPETLPLLAIFQRRLVELDSELYLRAQGAKGSKGHYQLDTFYMNLLRIARAAGDGLMINSHNDRYSKDVNFTPLILFVAELFRSIRADSANLLSGYKLTSGERERINRLLDKLLKKTNGNLILPLEQARTVLEGRSRAKKSP